MSSSPTSSSASTTTVTPAAPVSVYSPAHSAHDSSHSPRVLSIQSSVVYGYVGNKASVFPLQLLGFDVDPIHTCQLSNHTGYKTHTGRRTTAEELTDLITGLTANGMIKEYGLVVSGYMSTAALLTRWLEVVRELAQPGQVQLYLCDPVMGDGGRLYVPHEFVDLYAEVIRLAHVITPNQTEAELLTGRKIASLDDAVTACEALHAKGVRLVVITSLTLPEDVATGSAHPSHINIVATQSAALFPASSSSSAPRLVGAGFYHLRVPHVEGYWSGTGDLTSSLLLGWLWKTKGDVREALTLTISAVQAVMRATQKRGGSELQLISSQREMQSPRDSGIPIMQAEWRERQKR